MATSSRHSQIARMSMATSGNLRYSMIPKRNQVSSQNQQSQNQSPLAARLIEKQRELDSLLALRQVSATLVKQLTELGEKIDTMVEGTEGVASVLSSWQSVFRAINIAGHHLVSNQDQQEDHLHSINSSMPAPLVRIPTQYATTDL